MTGRAFDIVTVGGGLGGAALARAIAERGARVLVLERERRFADRVRGEALMPWGVAEARALGLEPLLRTTCGHELPSFELFMGGVEIVRRDLVATTVPAAPALAFYHPAMQEVLLDAATRAGAVVERGARVSSVAPGPEPSVAFELGGHVEEVRARLVVGADGRGSQMRKWAGFTVRRDPERLLFSGVLLDGVPVADEDWSAAGHAYAAEHDRYYAAVHRVDGWFADVFMEVGPQADERRARALPLIAADQTRIPDVPFSGPEQPADEAARRRFFGEE